MSNMFEQISLVLLPVIVGAAVAIVPTSLVERVRHREKIKTRWDAPLYTVCSEDFGGSPQERLSDAILAFY
jgi:hypothetical protein